MPQFINECDYPNDYSFLTEQQQKDICDELNILWHAKSDDAAKQLAERIDELVAQGIYPEIGWYGHRDSFFLATAEDAIEEDAYYNELYWDACPESDFDIF